MDSDIPGTDTGCVKVQMWLKMVNIGKRWPSLGGRTAWLNGGQNCKAKGPDGESSISHTKE